MLKKPVVWIRGPTPEDEDNFLAAMVGSQILHYPWVRAPQTSEEFKIYLQRYQQANQKSFWFAIDQEILQVYLM